MPKQRHYLAVFFLSFTWGTFGVDRFYLGKVWTGLLKLFTFGGFGLWVLIDMIIIMTGTVKDKEGRLTLGVDEYKKFSHKVILIYALVLGATILISGSILIAGAAYVVGGLLDGSLLQELPQVPGLETYIPAEVLDPTLLNQQ